MTYVKAKEMYFFKKTIWQLKSILTTSHDSNDCVAPQELDLLKLPRKPLNKWFSR